MRPIKSIYVHVTDSPDNLDVGAKEIREWHVKGRGWSDIGYHFVVRRNGAIEVGRPIEKIGAHVEGKNRDSIGIVWVGRDHIEPFQRSSLIEQVADLMDTYNIPIEQVFGHHEANPGKTCPNLSMDELRRDILIWRST